MGDRAPRQSESHAIYLLQVTTKKGPRVTRSGLGGEVQSSSLCLKDPVLMHMGGTGLMDGLANLKDVRGTFGTTQPTSVTKFKGRDDS